MLWQTADHGAWIIGHCSCVGLSRGHIAAQVGSSRGPCDVNDWLVVGEIDGAQGMHAAPELRCEPLDGQERIDIELADEAASSAWLKAVVEQAGKLRPLPSGARSSSARASSRRGFLTTVEELVGPKDASKSWRDEFAILDREFRECRGLQPLDPEPSSASLLHEHRHEVSGGMCDNSIKELVRTGWPQEDAEAVTMCLAFGSAPIGQALKTGRSSLVNTCHAVAEGLARAARRGEVAPPLYRGITGDYSLCDAEPAFAQLEEADATNFRGLTSFSPILLNDQPGFFQSDRGLYSMVNVPSAQYRLQDTDVLCVLSRPSEGDTFRSAVLIDGLGGNRKYALPPNTLLRLVDVQGPPFDAEFLVWTSWLDEDGNSVFMVRTLCTTQSLVAPSDVHSTPRCVLVMRGTGSQLH